MSFIMSDYLLFAILPYVALALFFVVSIMRYRKNAFVFSSLSSQFLENKQHFWSTVPFHYGLIGVLLIHLFGLLLPDTLLWWNSVPVRLVFLELTGLALAVIGVIGLGMAIMRRVNVRAVNVVTTTSDWVILAMTMVQMILGIMVAVYHGWGSSWFASSASPYLWSVFSLDPNIAYVAAMPLLVKLHIINAWLIIGYFPFTRLLHVLVAPFPYLWRKRQVVLWNDNRKTKRIP